MMALGKAKLEMQTYLRQRQWLRNTVDQTVASNTGGPGFKSCCGWFSLTGFNWHH